MDKRTIFSKTGKGSLEISKKSIKLSADERQALILVDGKSTLAEMEEKLSKIAPPKLHAIFETLLALDLIRVFVTKGGPDSISPSTTGSATAGIRVQEITEDDLDFTAFAPVAAASTGSAAREAEERRRQAEAAELAAREQAALREKEQAAEAAKRQAEVIRAEREKAEREARAQAEARERARLEEQARLRALAEAKVREDIARKAREEAERKAREEAERKAREEAERKAREEAERKAREEAERKAREEAERKAREEAERKAREEAERKAREEAERKAREEAERKAREEAERKAREEAERKAREEAERKAREAAELAARERAREEEAAKRREIAERAAREESARVTRQHAESRERARLEEERARLELANRQAKEEAQRKAMEESQRKVREEAERRRLEAQQQESARLAEDARRAEEEATRYTAALTPHLEAATAEATPAPMGAFANLSALESGAPEPEGPAQTSAAGTDSVAPEAPGKTQKQIEQEAKQRAKEEARARKLAEKEAKRLAAAESKAGGRTIGAGKVIAAVLLLIIGGAAAYLFSLSADKAAIEKMMGARFGAAVTVGEAKFTPFPTQLRLTNVSIGDLKLPLAVATGELSSLASGEKIWRSVEISGLELNRAQLERIAALATTESSRSQIPAFTVQRIRALGVTISDTPLPLPKFDATVLVAPNGTVKQATLALPDGRAQALIAPEDKGWLVDFESRGVQPPLGPKVAWESLRAKGIATREGIKLDEFIVTLAGGVARGTGDLSWAAGWNFSGIVDVGGIDVEGLAGIFYGAAPVSGPLEGKFKVGMSAASLPRLFDAPQIEGDFVVSRVVFKTLDLARLLQGSDPAGGQTRLPEMTGNMTLSGGKVQLRQLRGSSGLLSLSGAVDILPDKSLSGNLNVEVGTSGSRGRAALRISGALADPRIGR